MTITGRIYKITSPQTNRCYIGSTTKTIEERMQEHIFNNNEYLDGKRKYTLSSNEIIKYPDAIIELVEENQYENKQDMLKRERYYIESTENTVNKNIPIRTREEKQGKYAKYLDFIKNRKERTTCACGGSFINDQKKRHMKSQKHMNQMKTINITINITCEKVEICKND